MLVLIDTNVLFSAALDARMTGSPFKAVEKATTLPYETLICTQSLDELKENFIAKFPTHVLQLWKFLKDITLKSTIIPMPENESPLEVLIRDPDDRPILRAALANGVDILLTGDRDFLESGITQIRIMSPGEFLTL